MQLHADKIIPKLRGLSMPSALPDLQNTMPTWQLSSESVQVVARPAAL